jgi:hypothetical protein
MRISACAVVISVLLSAASGGRSLKRKVYVGQFGHDSVGQTLAYSLREEVSKSTRYEVVQETEADLKIELVSADLGEAHFTDRGRSSAISFVFTVRSTACAERDWLFLKQGVYITGSDRVVSTAKGILATLDGAVTQ